MSSRNVPSPSRIHALHRQLVAWGLSVLMLVALMGCGGSAGNVSTGGGIPAQTQAPVPQVQSDRTSFSAQFYTPGGQFIVTELEMEFYGGRRGKFYFFGFFRDQYDQPTQVDFNRLIRVDFVDQMNQSLFDQATLGREQLGLRIENAFQLRLHFLDGSQQEFFAFIPKLRGYKDFQVWELGMDSNQRQLLYLEFLP